MKLEGLAVPYNHWTNIGGEFWERFVPGAFADAPSSDVFAHHSHLPSQILGRTTNRTLRLQEAADGLRFTLDLPDTNLGRDLHALVARGDLQGISVGFMVPDPRGEKWWEGRDGEVYREIRKARLIEISSVARPAYDGTHVSARAEQNNMAAASPAVRTKAAMLRRLMTAKLDSRLVA